MKQDLRSDMSAIGKSLDNVEEQLNIAKKKVESSAENYKGFAKKYNVGLYATLEGQMRGYAEMLQEIVVLVDRVREATFAEHEKRRRQVSSLDR